ncbi:MAG: hypothetical protein H7296_13935 [Bacteroidia bacterium]|nr:hypothetical protein [Bacteroidia bacterium]
MAFFIRKKSVPAGSIDSLYIKVSADSNKTIDFKTNMGGINIINFSTGNRVEASIALI